MRLIHSEIQPRASFWRAITEALRLLLARAQRPRPAAKSQHPPRDGSPIRTYTDPRDIYLA